MIFNDEHIDPAMRYEGLARAAFNDCGKYDDPWRYAAQDRYAIFTREPINLDGKRMSSTILIKIIIDYPKKEQTERLIKLEESVWKMKSQQDAIKIIDEAIKIYKEIKHQTLTTVS